jgi:hypothetical protein
MYSKDYIFTSELTPKPTSYEEASQHPSSNNHKMDVQNENINKW